MEYKGISRQNKVYGDKDYIAGLKNGDAGATRSFFYSLCSYTLNDIRWSLMQGRVDYDELVNELYLYLSTDGWRKLDTFEGKNNCTLKSWMIRLSWRFFMQRRNRLLCGMNTEESETAVGDVESEDALGVEIAVDVESTFNRMPNKKYVRVLKWMLADGYDPDEVAAFLGTPVSNVYNIKHRAILQFIETYNG